MPQSVAPVEEGLDLVGRFDLGGKLGGSGRVADVSAKGNYAYLTMFYEPTCGRGGVQVVDIADPANPKAAGYIPSHVDTYSGEGSQVVTLNTRRSRETCSSTRTSGARRRPTASAASRWST